MATGGSKWLVNSAMVLMIALAAVSCGRRGGLEAPQSSSAVSVDNEGNEVTEVGTPEAEDKPFILDPLL